MSDDNVITFGGNKKPEVCAECGHEPDERLLLLCTNCGCRSFNLMSDGAIECCNCDQAVTFDKLDEADIEWRRIIATVPVPAEPQTSSGIMVTQLGDDLLAQKRVLKRLDQWSKERRLLVAVGYDVQGAGSQWVGIDNEEDRKMILEQLEDVIKTIKGYKF